MFKIGLSTILLVLAANTTIFAVQKDSLAEQQKEMESVAKNVALEFDYYDEISSTVPNFLKGESEIGGQCGDYALAFANKWNEKHPNEAFLVIQQQGIKQIPDGIYEIVGKDPQELPFLKNRTTSMLYIWNNVIGVGHPKLGGFNIELVKKTHVTSHFGLPNWERNGPHVWVIIGETSVDPTYADFGELPIIGEDKFNN